MRLLLKSKQKPATNTKAHLSLLRAVEGQQTKGFSGWFESTFAGQGGQNLSLAAKGAQILQHSVLGC